MRLALVLAFALVFGGVVVATAPPALACTSDPDILCGVIWTLDCVAQEGVKAAVKACR